MVGKKERHQPNPARLCEHRHAESVAETVGAVVEEKKHEDTKMTGRGVRNIAVELGVLTAVSFVRIVVKINGGDCKRGGDAPCISTASTTFLISVFLCVTSSVVCETGFSKLNLIKTKLRNRLCVPNLDNLMMVLCNGPNLQKQSK